MWCRVCIVGILFGLMGCGAPGPVAEVPNGEAGKASSPSEQPAESSKEEVRIRRERNVAAANRLRENLPRGSSWRVQVVGHPSGTLALPGTIKAETADQLMAEWLKPSSPLMGAEDNERVATAVRGAVSECLETGVMTDRAHRIGDWVIQVQIDPGYPDNPHSHPVSRIKFFEPADFRHAPRTLLPLE